MLYLGRKGDVQYSTIVKLLVILASFIVIVFFITKLTGEITERGTDARCKASIEVAARSKSLPKIGPGSIGIGRPYVKLDCPRKELVIKKSDVVENNKINQDKAHKIIADEMLSCWKKVGAGKLDPFANWDNKKTSYCLICDSIVFDKALKEFVANSKDEEQRLNERSIKEIASFLQRPPKEGQKSYYEQLYKVPEISASLNEVSNAIIADNSAIIIQMHKLEAQSSGAVVARFLIAGGVLALGVVASVATFGVSTAGVIAIVATFPLTGLVAVSEFVAVGQYAFAECKECNAVGGVSIIPSTKSFSHEIEINPKSGGSYTARICDIIAN